jgi:hypothetical protein
MQVLTHLHAVFGSEPGRRNLIGLRNCLENRKVGFYTVKHGGARGDVWENDNRCKETGREVVKVRRESGVCEMTSPAAGGVGVVCSHSQAAQGIAGKGGAA